MPTFPAQIFKRQVHTLQINLGRRCNLTCSHCHVEASPQRTEQLTPEVCGQILEVLEKFPQIQTVDLTGGAPEMHYGFASIVERSRALGKEVIVRSNLTIYFVPGYEYLPQYCADLGLRIVASLPCYLSENVDKMRGQGVFNQSIAALQRLNQLGYGLQPHLILDLVYNPALPQTAEFSLPPAQSSLSQAYRDFLNRHFQIQFNHLFTIANLPIGRTLHHLERLNLNQAYLDFLAANYNSATLEHLMCRDLLSIDYLGNIYDCDFHQITGTPASDRQGHPLTLADLLNQNSLEAIATIATQPYCYGCTAGNGSSCGGALL
ncbi:MAG: arsenosugar biosynthesis radical SAM protein ArsS [Pseudanabaenaceae cyanobacterium bins.68]|nr:arsenosugar biosynthesis radical SAM protein ArsS [Pseudanabaenaceae cyanobacterium bins.68]